MWYFVFVYFNWLPAFIIWGLNRWRKGTSKGFYFIFIGGILELFALLIHWSSCNCLKGEPDQFYVWIAPLFMAVIAFGLIIAGTLWSFSFAGIGILKGKGVTNIA